MSGVRRFACTQCGKCCNRSPEVELSEAAGLADLFVFRLMFRLYSLPRAPERGDAAGAELFYEKKRLLAAHAACRYSRKVPRAGKPVERIHYLMISAIALDTRAGACVALRSDRCSIYHRRPLACRSVPFHYSRPEALAEADFDTFVSTPGYRCDVAEPAPPVVEGGRIVDPAIVDVRAQALARSEADRPWKAAIVRRMKGAGETTLPGFREVEAKAGFAAVTTSFGIAWQIAAAEGLIGRSEALRLVELQLQTIEGELASGSCAGENLQTLAEMSADYRRALQA